MSFSDFMNKKQSMTSTLEKLKSANTGGDRKSEFYYPVIDKTSETASVILRFLPSKNGDDLPFVTLFSHAFKGDDGRWLFVDMCPTTIGKECPVCKINSELWRTELDANKKIVSARKRKKSYIFNVLVVSDPAQPEYEGKVVQYKCGVSIYNKILDAMEPKFQGQKPVNPFDIVSGCDFYLNVFRDPAKNGQISYEKSLFVQTPSPLCGGDEKKMEAAYNEMKDLNEYISESRLMSESELERRVYDAYANCGANCGALKLEGQTVPKAVEPDKHGSVDEAELPWAGAAEDTNTVEEDDSLDFFRKLSQES